MAAPRKPKAPPKPKAPDGPKTTKEEVYTPVFQGLSGKRYADMIAMVDLGIHPNEVARHFEVSEEYVVSEYEKSVEA